MHVMFPAREGIYGRVLHLKYTSMDALAAAHLGLVGLSGKAETADSVAGIIWLQRRREARGGQGGAEFVRIESGGVPGLSAAVEASLLLLRPAHRRSVATTRTRREQALYRD